MALTSTTQALPVAPPSQPTGDVSGFDLAGLALLAAITGVAVTKSGRKAMRKAIRQLAWKNMKLSIKNLFTKGKRIAGMDDWLFLLLVIALAAIGVWLFGLWGFLVILLLGLILYLLLRN